MAEKREMKLAMGEVGQLRSTVVGDLAARIPGHCHPR